MVFKVPPRQYFSLRTATDPAAIVLSLDDLKVLFSAAYTDFDAHGYWAEQFGYTCVDADFVPGEVGTEVVSYVTLCLHKSSLWPVSNNIVEYSEPDLFDVIEFLHDHISKPTEGIFHDYNNCGMHWTQFDRPAGRQEYRERLNVLLGRYGSGYELSDQGEILQIGPRGMNSLHSASLPEAPSNVANKVQAAVNRFRRYGSSIADRHSAVRDLADVLEYIRKQVKVVLLKKDESELFDLANNFGIRHFNETQKLEYDRAVWLSWMFYHYPATIHAFFHLMDRQRIEASAARLKGDTLPVDVMDQIRSHILLSDVIARRVTLARAGNEWKGLCPFHHETSPSFFVNDKKHFYHCFGCGAHGDVISFVSQTKKVTVSDAVKLLEASLKISK